VGSITNKQYSNVVYGATLSMLKLSIRRTIRFLLFAVFTCGVLIACNSQQPTAETTPSSPSVQPLVVASSPWPGFAGHYVAVAKDFFKEEGITVKDEYLQVATDVSTALLAGRLDLAWGGVPDLVPMASRDPSLRLIMVSDYSNGADGILARNVSKPEDLRGKEIAWENLPLQVLLLQKYLESGGLTQQDVKLLNITAAEAATAFASKKVDVAVTYEPWLSKAVQEGNGEIIFSSENSNIIPDGLITKSTVIERRKDDIAAYLRAVDKGVQFVRENPDEANQIVAERLGVKPEEVPALLDTVRLFSVSENRDVIFNTSDPMNVMDSLEFATKTSEAVKLINSPVDSTKLYDDSLIKEL
jgi:NitT/TauT family transport system substrate-binding protein